jgi:hypothetical protein
MVTLDILFYHVSLISAGLSAIGSKKCVPTETVSGKIAAN